jgi:START domain
MIQMGILIYLSLLLGLQVADDPKWQLVKEDQDLRVYTAVAGSGSFKSIKVEAVFEGSWDKFMAIVLDIENQPNWVYGTRRASLLKQVSNREILYYVETDLPWPASDRDTVIRMRIKENRPGNILTVTSVGEPRSFPLQENKVRVDRYGAKWEVKALGKDKLSFSYQLQVDPAGNLPGWIVNLFVSKGPYETFRNLSGLLKK